MNFLAEIEALKRVQSMYRISSFDEAIVREDDSERLFIKFDLLWYTVEMCVSKVDNSFLTDLTYRRVADNSIAYCQKYLSSNFFDVFPKDYGDYAIILGAHVDVLDEMVRGNILRRSIFIPSNSEGQGEVSVKDYIIYEDKHHNIYGVDASTLSSCDFLEYYFWNEDFEFDGFADEEALNEMYEEVCQEEILAGYADRNDE